MTKVEPFPSSLVIEMVPPIAIDESLHDGHTDPRPLIYTAGILSFLGEGIENMSQKLRLMPIPVSEAVHR